MKHASRAMSGWNLCRAAALCGAVLMTAFLGACSADAPSPAAVEAELRRLGADLHERINPAHPGRGTTDYPGNTAEDVPKSYAMVLLAELDRMDAGLKPESRNMAAAAGRWLLDHADENGDGVIGWGVPVAWDAYGDGSINPANTEYTISTAIVVDALLTWSERDADAPAREIMDIIDRSLQPYLDKAMRTPSGLVPYSLRVSDRPYDTFNPAAYLAGQLQRFSRKTQDPVRQMQLRTVADDTMRSLLEYRQNSPLKGRWYWNYSVQEEVANDLPHAGYIIDGIRTYIAYEGLLGEQFDRFAVLAHLRDFPVGGETVRAWPSFRRDVRHSRALVRPGLCAAPRVFGALRGGSARHHAGHPAQVPQRAGPVHQVPGGHRGPGSAVGGRVRGVSVPRCHDVPERADEIGRSHGGGRPSSARVGEHPPAHGPRPSRGQPGIGGPAFAGRADGGRDNGPARHVRGPFARRGGAEVARAGCSVGLV
ncbi:hypothetical protein ACFJGX_02690 [Hydrogenophaga sp. UC242_50]|uniref:hypothetical protein n=1 Tax=Hydrogenophaga sp. UC242_50 TaxID=3350169 RepID=UPI0036D26259